MRNRWIYSIISFAFLWRPNFDSGNVKDSFLYNCSHPTSFIWLWLLAIHTICTPSSFYINFIAADSTCCPCMESRLRSYCVAFIDHNMLSLITITRVVNYIEYSNQMRYKTQNHHPCYAIQFNYTYIYFLLLLLRCTYHLRHTYVIIIRIYLFRSQVRLLERKRKLFI